MARDDEGVGVGLARLPNGAGDTAYFGRHRAIGARFTIGDGSNCGAQLTAFAFWKINQRKIKLLTAARKPAGQLVQRTGENGVGGISAFGGGGGLAQQAQAKQRRVGRVQHDRADRAFETGGCGYAMHGAQMERNDRWLKGGRAMKFHIDVDCTPEEVRRLVGLPDLSEVHAAYIEQMKDVMAKGLTPDMVDSMVRNWMPGGAAGMDFMRDLMKGLSTPPKRD